MAKVMDSADDPPFAVEKPDLWDFIVGADRYLSTRESTLLDIFPLRSRNLSDRQKREIFYLLMWEYWQRTPHQGGG